MLIFIYDCYVLLCVLCVLSVFYLFVGFGSTALRANARIAFGYGCLCALIAWTTCICVGIASRSRDFFVILLYITKFCSGFNCFFVYDYK
ncbi:hypothetical protein V1505DRAFT_360303 [Lipomyces doorenjongii]